jgi:hypothetical protein
MSHVDFPVVNYFGRIFMGKTIDTPKANNSDKGKPAKRLGRKAMGLMSI